jgi:transposase
MRGFETQQTGMFSYVSLDERVLLDHPLRRLQVLVNGILGSMSKLFDDRYSHTGRPSIPPEQLLRALLLQILFTVRSQRQLMEQLDYNLLFRWFVGLPCTPWSGIAPSSATGPTARALSISRSVGG